MATPVSASDGSATLMGDARPDAQGAEGDKASQVGRYVVLEEIGRGGMGRVYRSYDPKLRREVAIKVLRTRGKREGRAGARVLREARAMARLSHPNVVPVYDVDQTGEEGGEDGELYIAMEYVPGETLADWMEQRRPWKTVLARFIEAGRGLAAAHRMEIIHRDFKPSNVMLGEDGRARVMDFGLARDIEEEEGPLRAADPVDADANLGNDSGGVGGVGENGGPLTEAGVILGTLAYMAPEQHWGRELDARTDVYAFCASFYEALHGGRPFPSRGGSRAVLRAKMDPDLATAPDPAVPRWLHRVIMRGLAPHPNARWPDMQALLDALEREPKRRRRIVGMMAGGLGIAVLGAVVSYPRYEHAQLEATCRAAGDEVGKIWNEDARAKLRSGLVDSGVSYAPVVAEKITPWIDAQAESWRTHATTACMDTHVHATWSAAKLDRANWCLEERRVQLATLLLGLSSPDEEAVRNAVQSAAALSPTMTCLDETTLAAMVAPPAPGVRARVAAAREDLSRAAYLQSAGKYEEGLSLAHATREDAEALEWPPLTAAALLAESSLLAQTGALEEAKEAGVAAYLRAAGAGTWAVAADAASELTHLVGYRQAQHEAGRRWADHAAIAISHAGDPTGLREAQRITALGLVQASAGDYRAAKELHARALAVREEAFGSDHPEVASSLNNLGMAHRSLGEREQARTKYERALVIWEHALGVEHPTVAFALNNLANLHDVPGERARAIELFERAIAIWERVFGPDHPNVATTSNNLGGVYVATGDLIRAKKQFDRALAIREKVLGPDHLRIASVLNNLGTLHLATHEYQEATRVLERAISIRERALGPEHPMLALPLTGLGNALTELGEHRRAITTLERAVAVRSAESARPEVLAYNQFSLAKAMVRAPPGDGQDRSRARSLAHAAQAGFAKSDPVDDEGVAEVQTWLVENGL